jgi:hypothetical protein
LTRERLVRKIPPWLDLLHQPETTMLPRSLVLVLTACVALLFSTPQASADDGKVTGVVTFKGKPLAEGKIVFHLKDGEFVGAKVKADGTYRLSRVPEGARKITVEVEGKLIPAKYASEETSGLTFEVKKGSQRFDIELR